jgi:site-specific DNA-cytosine methylase
MASCSKVCRSLLVSIWTLLAAFLMRPTTGQVCRAGHQQSHHCRVETLFGDADLKILAGCAPCQPFSTYAQRYELDGKDGKWGLLYEFARLAKGTSPDVITMENVPTVAKHEVFHDFVDTLKRLGYNVWFDVVDSSQYGVPQTAATHGAAGIKARRDRDDRTDAQKAQDGSTGDWSPAPLSAGEAAPRDKLHVSSTLSEKNLSASKLRSRAERGATGRSISSPTAIAQKAENLPRRLWPDGVGQACSHHDNAVLWVREWPVRAP